MGCKCSKSAQPYQPWPKDIPIELDVREITDNTELTGINIRGTITRALERSLKGYKVYEQTKQRRIPMSIRVLEVKRMDNKIIVTPDSTGTFLTYKLVNTKYDLYAAVDHTTNAVNHTTHSVVFLYQWKALKDQIFVTCPYIPDPTAGFQIPCVVVNITNALREINPVRAVMEELKKIINDDAKWDMDGAVNDFTISAPGRKIFWEDFKGSRDIKLTDNDSIKLVMNLEVVEGSPL